MDLQGGKLDDITVVLAMVDEEAKPEEPPEPAPVQSSEEAVASADAATAESSAKEDESEDLLAHFRGRRFGGYTDSNGKSAGGAE